MPDTPVPLISSPPDRASCALPPARTNADWLERSRRAVWHPCTQMKVHETLPLVPVARGDGAWLYDFDGNRYLDAVSSWWVNLFGHANPRISAALAAQRELVELQGIGGLYFAGVFDGYGFHEDGFVSGRGAAAALLRDLRRQHAA